MLKGLTFTAVKSGSKEPTVVVSCKYDETDYKTEIDDFAKCQHPKALLTTEACIDFICDNIQHADYKFNETKSKISLSLRVFQNVVIQMQLDCPETGTNNLELKIARLEKRLALLEPYELVTSHKYPKWETLEEFKQLPDFKYFKIVENYASLIRETAEKISYKHDAGHVFGTLYGMKYGVGKIDMATNYGRSAHFETFTASINIASGNAYVGAGINHYSHHPTGSEYVHGCIADRALLETLDPKKQDDSCVYFPRSVQVLVTEPYRHLSFWLNKYIDRFVRGFLLVNHESVAFRKVELVVNVSSKNNSCYIDIYRSRQPYQFGIFNLQDDKGQQYNGHSKSKISRKIYIDDLLVFEAPAE